VVSLESFHPIVSSWFRDTLGEPTAAQRRGWAAIGEGRHTLIAAPTGSGKTLAAFLTAIDELVKESAVSPLPDEVRVVYVSPLKALSTDIHKNLAEPRRGIRDRAAAMGIAVPRLTAAVRTGDTTAAERAAMIRKPPHILVTTPESLYLLLTSARSRDMLRTVRTVIVDEIHAVIGTRRGAHLALSLERLQQVADAPLLRLGLSATQKPVDEVARFLVGDDPRRGDCVIVDEGHRRAIDLAIEVPGSALGAVMAHEVWGEYYDRLEALIREHRTTLIFVNTRRMAERMARNLSERLGEDAVTAHHGSLSKETRLEAETRLKGGQLKALVATASLELGIDIGHVDLVCQIGSPHRIATLLQRVGRSGHTIAGTPKGRLLPVSRDDLIECAALLRAVRRGELDRILTHDAPLDVLAQQVTAEAACRECREDELFALVRRAWPYRDLARSQFDAVVAMLSDGFATRRGRRAALVHRDEVNGILRARRGSRLLALTSGGAIPEVADYRVILEPEETFVGTLNEDFAIESSAGDIFQLGNTSWQITQVVAGTVRVTDAHGAPPTIPFWLGEAPARSDELSRAVSDLRADAERLLVGDGEVRLKPDTTSPSPSLPPDVESGFSRTTNAPDVESGFSRTASSPPDVESGFSRTTSTTDVESGFSRTVTWFEGETGLGRAGAEQAAAYLEEGRRVLGAIPTQDTLVFERFFDESGGMQLVLHAPFGSRINRAWALALRKRFCRQFNFELQASATEDALLLSLGPQHSFPLADVFRYLHPATVRDILVQAFLDAPVFATRWRWNTTISLAVPRSRGGRKVAPQLQRMHADDLMAAVFPDAAACLENIPGDREIPDHPLVSQTVRDCLEEAMDLPGLAQVLTRIHRAELRLVSRDTPEPSVFADEILTARPYAFLDDAPLEERRAHAVQLRRRTDPADDSGALDAAAIERVRDEERPDPRDADELHDALLTAGFLHEDDLADRKSLPLFDVLAASLRAGRVDVPRAWVAAERLPEFLAVHPDAALVPSITAPPSRAGRAWDRPAAIAELLRGRLTICGPTTPAQLAASLCIDEADVDAALLVLEGEGVVLRGVFTPGVRAVEWCDRRLLARIHRYTLHRLRAEISPVSAAEFMRFLFVWQHLDPAATLSGPEGLRAVMTQLDGVELPARAWERDILPRRLDRYEASMLDMLCLTGAVGWARFGRPERSSRSARPDDARGVDDGHANVQAITSVAPPPTGKYVEPVRQLRPAGDSVGLPALRAGVDVLTDENWSRNQAFKAVKASNVVGATPIALFLREHADAWLAVASRGSLDTDALGTSAKQILEHLDTRGASFAHEIAAATGIKGDDYRGAIAELVAAGLVTSDGFAGLRGMLGGSAGVARQADASGRWSTLRFDASVTREAAIETLAWTLLRRYGVVFRRLLTRETTAVTWRELARVYRILEARGDIRGGRFVSGMSGEQFAMPDAVERLREIRRSGEDDRLLTISAADPLNLTGIVTPGERIRAVAGNRLVYRNGIPVSAMEGDMLRTLGEVDPAIAADVAAAAAGRRVPVVSGYVGRLG
jgi:ATP-dependent Lhr-like helicase